MELKGEVTIKRLNNKLETIETINTTNLVTNYGYLQLLDYNSYYNFLSHIYIFISSRTTTPSITDSSTDGIILNQLADNEPAIWVDTVEPPFVQVKARFNPPSTATTFTTVGLRTNPDTSNNVFAYLLLDTPCTQDLNEYLDIYYRIQFIKGNKFLTEKAYLDYGKNTIAYNFRPSYLYATPFNLLNLTQAKFLASSIAIAYHLGPGYTSPVVGWDTNVSTVVANHFKFKYILKAGLNDYVGIIFNTMLQGITIAGEEAYSAEKYVYLEEPFQTGFWHTSTSTVPFFSPSTLGGSKGKITLSGTWTNKIPELYKIFITTSGSVGTARYKLSVRKHLGFTGNNYTDRTDIASPYLNPNSPFKPGIHGYREENNDIHRWSDTQIIQYDDTGVTLLDIFSGESTTWDLSTTPQLSATRIRQVAVDTTNKKIYVACRITGLWIINVTTNTITRPITSQCYGVDVGRDNIAFAISNGLYSSDNNFATALPFSFSDITSNWQRVHFLKVDPVHANDRIAIVCTNGTGTNRVVWHEVSGAVSVLGPQTNEIRPWCAGLDVNNEGLWINYKFKLIFNTDSFDFYGFPSSKVINHSIYGQDDYYKIEFYNNKLVTYNKIVNADGTDFCTYNNLSNTNCLHLKDGIFVSNRYVCQLLGIKAWIDYGWNGSAWVQNHSDDKLSSTNEEITINGLKIKFQNGSGFPHFISSEHFIQGVNYGMLKDNVTDQVQYVSQWYSKSIEWDNYTATIASTLILPASALPSFIRVETDTPEVHQFKINNVLVNTVYVNNEPPGMGEITINGLTGVIKFNMQDAGKTFTARYLYIKN